MAKKSLKRLKDKFRRVGTAMRSFATITLSSHHYQILSSLKSNKTNLIVFIIAMGNPNKGLPKS